MTNDNETTGVGSKPYVSPVRRLLRPWAWMLEGNDFTEPRAGQIMVDKLLEGLQSEVKEVFFAPNEEIALTAVENEREAIARDLHRCFVYRRGNHAAMVRGEIFPFMPIIEINRQPPSPSDVARMRAITDRMYWMNDDPSEISSIMIYRAMLDDLERWNDARPEETSPIRIEEVITWLSRWLYTIDILIWRRDHAAEMPPREAFNPGGLT